MVRGVLGVPQLCPHDAERRYSDRCSFCNLASFIDQSIAGIILFIDIFVVVIDGFELRSRYIEPFDTQFDVHLLLAMTTVIG